MFGEGQAATCEGQLASWNVDFGVITEFDEGYGHVYLISNEACWKKLIDIVEDADAMISAEIRAMEKKGLNPEDFLLPDYETYRYYKDNIIGYTDKFHLLISKWSWDSDLVTPGHSAGLCIANQFRFLDVYWSCWEYRMDENGDFEELHKNYLIDPKTFDMKTSRLSDY